jgi:hypothetical protein
MNPNNPHDSTSSHPGAESIDSMEAAFGNEQTSSYQPSIG